MKFDQYFSLFEIAKALSALRIKVAFSRHRYQMYWSRLFLHDKNGKEKTPKDEKPSDLDVMLPPRRLWHRGDKKSRKKRSTIKVAELSIIRIICGAQRAGTLGDFNWGCKFLEFCEKVTTRVTEGDFVFAPPTIKLVRKSSGRIKTMDESKKQVAYRCISTFTNLVDRVIIGKTATYLRDVFDHELLDCCYAFRRYGKKFSFRTAVENLIAYRRRFEGRTLFVADCDVQKFFDVINHNVIRSAFDSFVQRLGEHGPDERARRVLDAYLKAYSFPRNLDECPDPEISERRGFVERIPDSVLSDLYSETDLHELRLGIPQGGALSPLLANIVMDAVDRAVLSGGDNDLFYARFCDDIIIVHPDRHKCNEALQRYLNAMRLLKLPIHKLSKKTRYSAAYFTEKSKGPVAWKQTSMGLSGTNWVNFLGHQIRYDGVVRIRKETIRKHQERLTKEKTYLFRILKKAKGQYRYGKDWKDLFKVFQMRIAAMGIGRIGETVRRDTSRNWLWVFRKNLDSQGPVVAQMKNLDRTRSGVLVEVKSILKSVWRNVSRGLTVKGDDKDHDASKSRIARSYLGAPFSYYGSLQELTRPTLEDLEITDSGGTIGYSDL